MVCRTYGSGAARAGTVKATAVKTDKIAKDRISKNKRLIKKLKVSRRPAQDIKEEQQRAMAKDRVSNMYIINQALWDSLSRIQRKKQNEESICDRHAFYRLNIEWWINV